MEHYIYKNRQKLRCGYTTGSCAAAAAKAAAVMLLCQSSLKKIDLMTPKGILLHLDLHDVQITSSNVTCAVKKDSGDDRTLPMVYLYMQPLKNKQNRLFL